jgi:transcriptional regulator with XRE-family HTH domain
LRTYRQWSGGLSLRKIAAQSGDRISHSTIRAILASDSLPSLAHVEAIIAGCGGTSEEQRAFATAWRLLKLAAPPIADAVTAPHAVERLVSDEFMPRLERRDEQPDAATPAREEPSMSFGELLRKLRVAVGLTQEELANRSRVSVRAISDMERGRAIIPRLATARLLADALNLENSERALFMAVARGRS